MKEIEYNDLFDLYLQVMNIKNYELKTFLGLKYKTNRLLKDNLLL